MEYPEERDRLLIKQLELKIINTFNMFRIPFVIGSFGVCLLAFFRPTRQPLYIRLLPLVFLGTFSSMYNYHLGQYGVYRNIDKIYEFLTGKEESEVGREAKEFVRLLEEQEELEVERRRELRRKREQEEKEQSKVTILDAVAAST